MVASRLPALVIVYTLIGSSTQQCDPAKCVLPACRCCDDKMTPGKLNVSEIPQIIMVSFQGTVSEGNIPYYKPLLELTNPNGCKARGTFFIQDQGSDYATIKRLYDEGHEIGIHSVDGKPSPGNANHWNESFRKVKQKLVDVNIKESDIKGVRLPELMIDGTDEFNGIGNNGLLYDSTCSSVAFSDSATFRWPCTFDYPEKNICDNGQTPDDAYPGIWEVMLTDLHDLSTEKLACVVPSVCRNITTKRNAFDLFFNAFNEHYTGMRTPYNMIIDAAWPTNTELREGTVEFLEYTRAAFGDDVWVVPVSKALDWVQKPTAITDLKDFAPWMC